jgi:Cytochrome P450
MPTLKTRPPGPRGLPFVGTSYMARRDLMATLTSWAKKYGDIVYYSFSPSLGSGRDGSAMTDQQLCDEVITLLLAGHETTAPTLSWAWYLLTQYPEVEKRLHEELDAVLGGRLPTARTRPNCRIQIK